jgi:hypothetical protein
MMLLPGGSDGIRTSVCGDELYVSAPTPGSIPYSAGRTLAIAPADASGNPESARTARTDDVVCSDKNVLKFRAMCRPQVL